jgi:hypothetical protein
MWLIYKENPRLSVKKQKLHSPKCVARYAEHVTCPEESTRRLNCLQYCYHAYYYDWLTYVRHPVRMAGLALALLYMTVMGFDAVTTGTDLFIVQCTYQIQPNSLSLRHACISKLQLVHRSLMEVRSIIYCL